MIHKKKLLKNEQKLILKKLREYQHFCIHFFHCKKHQIQKKKKKDHNHEQ